ncbi:MULTISPECIES: HAD-IA family hydrolase [unclassified Streptomyces]|uniref:HAD family hydrolase n=1 Tax=unclassified Streptomyces TaxID=2593676 RepID=UPI002E7FB83E|nr:HAD-IA family hydrolase [Streptomyces sp. NBC_00589]WTI36507.1 HAD-IA family hydrolase [Streptomyces sp. NBC_00775]WUB29817.1 HAD-IA family hydrolase [Streptomyces sp. NBC_00589]
MRSDNLDVGSVTPVLFDVDGVLIDTADAHGRVWRAWARLHGLDPEAVWRATQGRRRTDTLRRVAPDLDPVEEHRVLDRLMAAEEPGFRAFDGAAPLLHALPPHLWAVVTSSRATPTAARLARTGLPVPQVRVCAEDVSEGKPSPEGYLTAAARLAVDPARCVVVEDSPAGIEAGLAAGCTVYAVASTHSPAELARAHVCFPSLSEAARELTPVHPSEE